MSVLFLYLISKKINTKSYVTFAGRVKAIASSSIYYQIKDHANNVNKAKEILCYGIFDLACRNVINMKSVLPRAIWQRSQSKRSETTAWEDWFLESTITTKTNEVYSTLLCMWNDIFAKAGRSDCSFYWQSTCLFPSNVYITFTNEATQFFRVDLKLNLDIDVVSWSAHVQCPWSVTDQSIVT